VESLRHYWYDVVNKPKHGRCLSRAGPCLACGVAPVAQLEERLSAKREVAGSNPVGGTPSVKEERSTSPFPNSCCQTSHAAMQGFRRYEIFKSFYGGKEEWLHKEEVMTPESTFKQGIQVLIDKAEAQREEVRERYARELAEALATIDAKIEHYRCTLNDYLVDNGLTAEIPVNGAGVDYDALLKRMKSQSYRQRLKLWSDAHGNRIVMKDLVNAVTKAGFVDKRMEAHRAFYSAMAFALSKGDFEKVEPGIYEVPRASGNPQAALQLITTSAPEAGIEAP
jgi:hypothetical protein